MSKVKLKQLKIEKYRNVAPGTTLEFNDGFNVLLGQNGTGKTTLLKLIAMVTASRFGSLKDTEFSLEYTLGFDGASVEVAIENVRDDSEALLNEPFAWSYRVGLTVKGLPDTWIALATIKEMRIYVGEPSDDDVRIPSANPFERGLLFQALYPVMHLLKATHEDKHIGTVFEFPHFELHNIKNGRRFDEILGGLDSITGAVNQGDAPSASFQFVRPTNGSQVREREMATFIPQSLEVMMRGYDHSSRLFDGIVAKHEEVDFLEKAVNLMGFKGAEMLLRLRKREPVDDGERLTFSNFEFTMRLEDDTVIPHDFLSYGQKRLLAFLYYVAANDVIIADEIVNGMHHNWIEACLRDIGDRQSFLTSQNPLLLDFLPFTSAQDVERTFILCSNETHEGRRRMSWRNMSEEDAHTFFRSYKTQALQVSEILRSRGWW